MKVLDQPIVPRHRIRGLPDSALRAGFTVMELLMVVTCIAILMAIVAPKFYQITGRYRLPKETATLNQTARTPRNCFSRKRGPGKPTIT